VRGAQALVRLNWSPAAANNTRGTQPDVQWASERVKS
jgi:hypothetical protein